VRSSWASGAEHSRIVANWFSDLSDPNEQLRHALLTLRARSRQLCRDNGEASGLLLDFEADIIGRAAPSNASACIHEGNCASLFFASGAAHAADFRTSVIANQDTDSPLTLVVTGIWNSATNDAVVVQDFSVDAVG
jgi:capsid protein